MTDQDGTDTEVIHYLTQPTRASIVQTIIGHPENAPSKTEIDYMIPSKSPGTISQHLNGLREHGYVERVRVPDDIVERDGPDAFYTLTPDGWDVLERHNLFIPDRDRIAEEYEAVEKSDKVRRYEGLPRRRPASP